MPGPADLRLEVGEREDRGPCARWVLRVALRRRQGRSGSAPHVDDVEDVGRERDAVGLAPERDLARGVARKRNDAETSGDLLAVRDGASDLDRAAVPREAMQQAMHEPDRLGEEAERRVPILPAAATGRLGDGIGVTADGSAEAGRRPAVVGVAVAEDDLAQATELVGCGSDLASHQLGSGIEERHATIGRTQEEHVAVARTALQSPEVVGDRLGAHLRDPTPWEPRVPQAGATVVVCPCAQPCRAGGHYDGA